MISPISTAVAFAVVLGGLGSTRGAVVKTLSFPGMLPGSATQGRRVLVATPGFAALNLVAPDPKVFVNWRAHDEGATPPVFPVIVTVSYNEAARMLDGGERVDAVPLPAGILAWMQPFVDEHYKPEPKKRVRRNDPFATDASRRERGPRG